MNSEKEAIGIKFTKKLISNYIQFLKEEYPSLVKLYQDRLQDNLTAARAEAVTFNFFTSTLMRLK